MLNMLNYEGSCTMSFSEDCGLRAEKSGERLALEMEDYADGTA